MGGIRLWLKEWWDARKAQHIREARAYAFALNLPDLIADIETRLASKQAADTAAIVQLIDALKADLESLRPRKDT